jgi:hypothetical protein
MTVPGILFFYISSIHVYGYDDIKTLKYPLKMDNLLPTAMYNPLCGWEKSNSLCEFIIEQHSQADGKSLNGKTCIEQYLCNFVIIFGISS